MSGYIKKGILIVLGAAFLVLGAAGLVLPFLQGILFLLIGVILLSIASTGFRTWAERHTRRFPHIHEKVERLRTKIERFIGD